MKKKILIIGSALMLCLSATSCGGKSALDINTSDLESACDHVDALDQITDELIGLTDDGELGDDEKELFDKLMDKGDEVGNAAQDKFPRSEGEACPGWEGIVEKMDKVDAFR